MATKLIHPSGAAAAGTTIQSGGVSAVVDANGFVTVPAGADVNALLGFGYRFAAPELGSQDIGANGIAGTRLALLDAFCQDGAPLAAAAAAGDFGVTCTPGTVLQLISEVANNNTKTDKALWEFVVPDSYVAGQDLSLIINAEINGAGTPGTKTVDAEVFEQATNGTGTTDICATAAQAIAANAADYTFTITGTNIAPGDVLLVVVTIVLQETAATALTAVINSARFA